MVGVELRQAFFSVSFTSRCDGLANLASLFLPEQDIPFHCLTYDVSFDSFLDDHGQAFADVFFLFIDPAIYLHVSTVPKSSTHTVCL